MVLYHTHVGRKHRNRRCQVIVDGDSLVVNTYWANGSEPDVEFTSAPTAEESGILTLVRLMVEKALAHEWKDVRQFIMKGVCSLKDLMTFIVSLVGDAVYGEFTVLSHKMSALQSELVEAN